MEIEVIEFIKNYHRGDHLITVAYYPNLIQRLFGIKEKSILYLGGEGNIWKFFDSFKRVGILKERWLCGLSRKLIYAQDIKLLKSNVDYAEKQLSKSVKNWTDSLTDNLKIQT